MSFNDIVDTVGKVLDAIGIVIILAGSFIAIVRYFSRRPWKEAARGTAYRRVRLEMGQGILLGLEFLVAGDIIKTVATTPSFTNVGVLGLIIVIRTFLSIALQGEVEHRWPWQKDRLATEELPEGQGQI